MIQFRHFRNSDPPFLFELCRRAELGRGAAQPSSIEAYEIAAYGLPYFDPEGLIIAVEDGKVVGFAHAGFGFSKDLNSLDHSRGVICWIVVSPTHQRRGLGRELLQRAEEYLLQKGAQTIQAGQSRYCDPFYFGLYGGARCSGFLESDAQAAPFMLSAGYEPESRSTVFQRDLRTTRDPMNIKLMGLRRRSELQVMEQPKNPTMWWLTHFGNIESMYFSLVEKRTKERIGSLTVVGLDHFMPRWGERVIGLVDLYVEEKYRSQGFATTLIIETLRRLRSDFITRAEIHVVDSSPGALKAIETASFEPIDAAVVYRKKM
ncbi:GNAT family N-acetyltransferase [Thalassoglobus sp. JC818]|uniref:GNAT family N-acetyltransferase n=1 Tax=Thalassoglobus sp. JC818 TaxID=3232136 RepID=UPI0034597AB6